MRGRRNGSHFVLRSEPLCPRSAEPRERAAGLEQRIDAASNLGVGFNRLGMMRLEARVDDERAGATPMLVFDERTEAVDVHRGIGARESDPEEVGKGLRGEGTVINEDDERETVDSVSLRVSE